MCQYMFPIQFTYVGIDIVMFFIYQHDFYEMFAKNTHKTNDLKKDAQKANKNKLPLLLWQSLFFRQSGFAISFFKINKIWKS